MFKNRIAIYFLLLTFFFTAGFANAETTIDKLVKTIVRPSNSSDLKMEKIEKWIIQNIHYKSDIKQFNMMERWTLPMETLQRRSGDCEDGSILLIALAVTAEVPSERLRLYAPIKVPNGWHACVAYQRESDDKWVWMEWAWKRNRGFAPVDRRRSVDEVPAYSPVGTYLSVTSLNPFNMAWGKD